MRNFPTSATIVTFRKSSVSQELFSKLANSPAKIQIQGPTITVDLDKLSERTKLQLAREVDDLWVLTVLVSEDDLEVCMAAMQNPCITVSRFHYLTEHTNSSDEYLYRSAKVQAMLALSTHEEVRCLLANQPDLWMQTQLILAYDPNLTVRETIFRNKTLAFTVRKRILDEYPNLTKMMEEMESE